MLSLLSAQNRFSRANIILSAVAALSTCYQLPASAITLVDAQGKARRVPKSKFLVFLVIGHSNVSAVNKQCADAELHPRAWSYRWDDGEPRWEQARETALRGLTKRGTGGPAMVLLKQLVAVDQWSDHTFGVIQNAKPSAACQFKSPDGWHDTDYDRYKQGKGLYSEIVSLANAVKGQVTLAGIVVHLGWIEFRVAGRGGYQVDKLAADLKASIEQIRQGVGIADLPAYALKLQTEAADVVDHPFVTALAAYKQVASIGALAQRVAHVGPSLRSFPRTQTDDYMDPHHFGVAGNRKAMRGVVRAMQANGWGPAAAPAAPVIVQQPAWNNPMVKAGETVTLSVAVTGYPLPEIQWQRDGVAIPGATLPSHAFRAFDDGARYTARATNAHGEQISAEVEAKLDPASAPENHPPDGQQDEVLTEPGQETVITALELLANDSDQDVGDTLRVAGVPATSSRGASLVLIGDAVVYTPPPGWSGDDEFDYLVADEQGAMDQVTVRVRVGAAVGVSLVSPGAGERLTAGKPYEVVWTTSGVDAVKVSFSAAGPDGPWSLVCYADDSQASWPSCEWTVPEASCNACYLRAEAFPEGPTALGEPFAIEPPPRPRKPPAPAEVEPPPATGCGASGAPRQTSAGPFALLLLGLVALRGAGRRSTAPRPQEHDAHTRR